MMTRGCVVWLMEIWSECCMLLSFRSIHWSADFLSSRFVSRQCQGAAALKWFTWLLRAGECRAILEGVLVVWGSFYNHPSCFTFHLSWLYMAQVQSTTLLQWRELHRDQKTIQGNGCCHTSSGSAPILNLSIAWVLLRLTGVWFCLAAPTAELHWEAFFFIFCTAQVSCACHLVCSRELIKLSPLESRRLLHPFMPDLVFLVTAGPWWWNGIWWVD